jgi:hypothetical protein
MTSGPLPAATWVMIETGLAGKVSACNCGLLANQQKSMAKLTADRIASRFMMHPSFRHRGSAISQR